MDYRVDLRKDTNGTIMATIHDIPWVHTFGKDRDDALRQALDALLTGLDFLVKMKQTIPPSVTSGGARLTVPATVAAKIALHNVMVDQGVTRAELARRLKLHRPQVDRLFDMRHGSKIDQLEAACEALGKRLEISVAA